MAAKILVLLLAGCHAIDNGLGRTPPMGWRSWNVFGPFVDQPLMQTVMDSVVSRKRSVDGVPTSLCDLGYCDVGLDDNWQLCHGGDKYSYHDDAGNPLVNQSRFPDMTAMTSHAHKLGLTAGWYGNNCICSEQKAPDAMYQGDVAALVKYGFDAIKLDGCGGQLDLDRWAELLNQTGRPVMIENCHWGSTVPNATWCPWNFFRTSTDVRAEYGSVVANLQTTVKWAQQNLSRPGCWAYPDMLEVGCRWGPHGRCEEGLTYQESRSHFGAWAIVSSPLTLSFDITNDTTMAFVWDIIANKEVIAVNQAWAGHSGSPFKQAMPQWQYFYKPVGAGKVAVLLMNHDSKEHDFVLHFGDVPGLSCGRCHVRCLYGHKDLGVHDGNISAEAVASHDSRMFLLTPEAEMTYV